MKSSSTVQNVVLAFGGRPAPDTPDAASTMTFGGSTSPARTSGASARMTAGRVAAGGGDPAGAADLVAVELGQAVRERSEQVGPRVRLAVPAARRSTASSRRKSAARSMTQPSRAPTHVVDHVLAGAVREADEHAVDAVEQRRLERRNTSFGWCAARLGYRSAMAAPAWVSPVGPGHLQLGMAGRQSQQLGPGEAGRADDAHGDHAVHLSMIMHDHCIIS